MFTIVVLFVVLGPSIPRQNAHKNTIQVDSVTVMTRVMTFKGGVLYIYRLLNEYSVLDQSDQRTRSQNTVRVQ